MTWLVDVRFHLVTKVVGKAYGRLAFFILEKRKVDMVDTEIPNARGDTMLRDVLYRSSMQH